MHIVDAYLIKKISNTTPRIANTARKTTRLGTNEILEPGPTTVLLYSLTGRIWDPKSCQIWFTNHWPHYVHGFKYMSSVLSHTTENGEF
jgi:hypothetical protein